MSLSAEQLIATLRCPNCGGELSHATGNTSLACEACNLDFPIVNGVPRMLLPAMRKALTNQNSQSDFDKRQAETALSFGYEWTRFPEMYREWEQSFLDYMQPHAAEFFHGKKILDAGCGNGRFAYYAAKYGAEGWAIDLGPAVESDHTHSRGARVGHGVRVDLHRPALA